MFWAFTLARVATAAPVDLPLYRGSWGGHRALVEVEVQVDGASHPTLAVVGASGCALGDGLAARWGLPTRPPRLSLSLRLAGHAALATCTVVEGDQLVLGVSELALAVAVLPSEGVVRVAPPGEGQALLDALGGAQAPTGVAGAVPGRLQLEGARMEGVLALRPGRFRSELYRDTGAVGVEVAGVLEHRAVVALAGVEMPPTWVRRHAADAGGRLGTLGYDVLYAPDMAWAGDAVAVRPTATPRSHDPRAWLREQALASSGPPPRPRDRSWPEGDPGDPVALARHRSLGRQLWHAGDTEAALRHFDAASRAGVDRCGPWLDLGRRIRAAGRPVAHVALERAAGLHDAWALLAPGVRERVRRGRRVPDDTFLLEQPCGDAWAEVVVDALVSRDADAALAVAETVADHADVAWAIGLSQLVRGDAAAAEGPLRQALARGRRADVDLRLALARSQAAQGRELPVEALVERLPRLATDHPFTAALIARELADVPPAAELVRTGGFAAALAAAVEERRAADALAEAYRDLEARRARAPAVRCLGPVQAALAGDADAPAQLEVALRGAPPTADCVAAQAVVAALRGDRPRSLEALAVLRRQWPWIPTGTLGLWEDGGGLELPRR